MPKPKTIAVIATSMSRQSGGIMSVYKGLMSSAGASENRYIYITADNGTEDYPENVSVIVRPKLNRLATQLLVSLPGIRPILATPGMARFLVSLASGTQLPKADATLWSHCFAPVPNLGKTVTIQADMIHKHYPDIFSARQLALRRAGERSLQHCKAILSISKSSANDLLDSYPEYAGKTHIFHLAGVETPPEDSYRSELIELKKHLGDKKLLLFVAVDWPHKNHQILIAAAKLLLHTKTLPFELVFIGHRRTGLLSRLIQESGVGHVVKDLGTQTTSTVAAHYAASTIVLFPSKCEGFGIPLVEAMQYGKPILAGTHKCIQEVGGAAPDYLDPDNPHAWANRIRDLLADNQQLAKMADRSKFESRRFSWENSWKSINPIFQQ